MPSPLKLVHTCVRVRDIDASLKFYEALGFERRGKLAFESAYNIYMGVPGDGDTLELTVNAGQDEAYDLGNGYGHIALTVDDLDGLLASLAEQGYDAREGPVPPGRARGVHDLLHRRSGRLPDRAHRRRGVPHAAGRLTQPIETLGGPMQFMVRFDVHQPVDMSAQELVNIWNEEAKAALGAVEAGAITGIWKVAGQRTVFALVEFPVAPRARPGARGAPDHPGAGRLGGHRGARRLPLSGVRRGPRRGRRLRPPLRPAARIGWC